MAALIVDRRARTIAGVAVPYGPVAVYRGRRWRYAPGCLVGDWRAVPLLLDHVQALRVGRAAVLDDTPAGLWSVFRVDRGRRGDRALALAADGVFGLSAGVDVVSAGPDPVVRAVRLVGRALLLEISLTRDPAFEEPR